MSLAVSVKSGVRGHRHSGQRAGRGAFSMRWPRTRVSSPARSTPLSESCRLNYRVFHGVFRKITYRYTSHWALSTFLLANMINLVRPI